MYQKIFFNKLESYLKKKKNFFPTGTSQILADCAIKLVNNRDIKILDFGCGIGVVGISIFKKKKIKNILYASDISKSSIELCKLNAKKHKINKVSRRLKALSHPDRLKIVSLLINAEYTVQSLSKKIGIPQSTLSQHLTVLRDRDLVDYRKDGQYSHYRLRNNNVSELYMTAMQLYYE